ncbi:MAG: TonB-dependent receptor, partial [Candidatus Latescibacteria bacterium]|nr:TonB-dependent receptor [Candidatus Latescibacterota bacterium]
MKRILQLVLCALVFTVSAQAANEFGGVRGTVRDASNGETLPNANVVIDSLQMGMATDKVGYFVIKNLSPGLPTISASYVGYESRSIVANVKLGETARLVIELEQAALMGEEIEAVGERVAPTELTPVSAFGTRVTELARIPTVGQPDLMRGIQLLPGVQAASENSAGLYVRGGTPGQNLILLDDVVVYNPNHLFGFFSTFNPDALKDVT